MPNAFPGPHEMSFTELIISAGIDINEILLCLANNNYVWKRLTIHDKAFSPVAIAALIVNCPRSYERIDCTRLVCILGFKKQSQMCER